MNIPKQTAQLFEILSKGQFINSNSSDDQERKLYNMLDNEENYDALYNYFQQINFILEKGDGYYYLSRIEAKADLERKIEQAFKWIDILDFFKTFDSTFGSGFRFSPSDILVQLNLNAELKTKIEMLKRYAPNRTKHAEILAKIINDMKSDRFIEMENEISEQYKVLSSFKYLEDLVLTIHITDEAKNEIPE
ncbi:hypothetical protein SDC9_114056 [bioreactor metagenome]|uniref:Uncharacterized protein n=1 Tax=bioreactor metagenome TaxID=1076179 RepID=A0A645BNU0_9ZZZZ